jgi:hypothetical protein
MTSSIHPLAVVALAAMCVLTILGLVSLFQPALALTPEGQGDQEVPAATPGPLGGTTSPQGAEPSADVPSTGCHMGGCGCGGGA